MYPSAVYIVLNGPMAAIHELDYEHKDSQIQNIDGGRWLLASSREVARAIIEQVGKQDNRCEHCRAS